MTSVTIANIWYGTPFAMILIAAGADQHPGGPIRGRRARRRRAVRAVRLHHAAGAVADAAGGLPAW